jgi:hypothetical protein
MLNYQISRKSVQWELSCSIWTDGRTDMTELIDAYRKFPNAPKNWLFVYLCVCVCVCVCLPPYRI